MSIQVNDFQWEPGKNDAEYIKLLESSRDEWQKIAQKAIAKLKALSRAQEPRLMTLEEARNSLMIEYRSGNTRDVGAKLFGNFAEWHNKVWRVWTSRPTDEQREAEPWN